MRRMLTALYFALALTAAGFMSVPSAHSADKPADYPKKPITLICPWAAGGSSDLSTRMIASLSKKYLGVPMNVVNRTGGNGAVALSEMAKRTKPDGYTMSLASAGNFTTMPYVQDVDFDIDEFSFVIGTTSEPLSVIVRSDSKLTSLKDIVERFKADGKTVRHGQSGTNGANYLHSVELFRAMGVKEQVVPYAGASRALAALLGGEVEMILIHPGMVLSNIKSGDVRIIGMIYNQRAPTFPEVPTVEEQGYGKVHAETYKSLLVPAKTDPKIVAWLTENLNKLMQDPKFQDFLKKNGLERSFYLGEEVKKVIKAEVQVLWPLMEETGLLKAKAVRPKS